MASREVLVVVCKVCGSALGVKDPASWLEHHDDGSHTWHPAHQPSEPECQHGYTPDQGCPWCAKLPAHEPKDGES